MTREISIDRLSCRAREYFGGDVQGFWIEREPGRGATFYSVVQRPHWGGGRREAARVCALSARDAAKQFNRMARGASRSHS